MAKKKKVDPIKQREKRAKIVAAIGGVLLIGVAAIEVPSVMKQLNKKAPVAAVAPAAATSPDGSLALPQVGAAATATTSSSGLADTDAPPVASSSGQLVTFNAFTMKNPFKPQVSSVAVNPNPPDPTPGVGAGVTTPSATAPATSTTSTPETPLAILTGPRTAPTSTTPTSTTPNSTSTTPTTTTPTGPTVAISVNGSVSLVGKAGAFPTAAPVFRLVSWQRGSAKIAIVGGSYATGGQTLTLLLKQPVTLQNTHDGKQYKLILESTP